MTSLGSDGQPHPWLLEGLFLLFLLGERREGGRERDRDREWERSTERERSSALWDKFNLPPSQKEREHRASFFTSMPLRCNIDFQRYSCCDLFNSFSPLILIKFLSCLQARGAGTKHETPRAKCVSFAIEFFRVLKVLHRREGERHWRLKHFLCSISPQIINIKIKIQLRKITEVITAWRLMATLIKSFMQFHSFWGNSLSWHWSCSCQTDCFLPADAVRGAQDLPLPNQFHLWI